MTIDLRSDTVTKPTKPMYAAMLCAEIGDDVLQDDPSVNALEQEAAQRFGHEAALFCPSGTMTNQIAVKVHTNAPGEIICDQLAHIYCFEGGGMAFNSGVSSRLIEGDLGRFTAEQVSSKINDSEDIHLPPTQLVSIENTCNKGGGSLWQMNAIVELSAYCKKKKLPLHLDGARIYNALVAQQISEDEMGKHFDSISICLSKGLGCPVGSLLIGSKDFIKAARRIRKILGGGMRQSGYLAAAGIYALNHHIDRLAEDHKKAKYIATALSSSNFVNNINKVESNIIIFELRDKVNTKNFIEKLKDKNVLVSAMGPKHIRMVTHLDISDAMTEKLRTILSKIQV